MNVNGMATITIVVLAARGCSEGFRDARFVRGPELPRSRAPGRGPQP
jgi:hypothetical protein